MSWADFISLDFPALTAVTSTAVACALLGNYLILRRMSLMGDAISHSVLPGIVVAFLLTSDRETSAIFIGAVVAGVLSAGLIELVKQLGRLEAGAAMGVIFSIFFAAGVLLMEQAAARHVDLDVDCLLHGQLESIFWFPSSLPDKPSFLEVLALLPFETKSSVVVLLGTIIFITILYKELAISSFDPLLSTSLGYRAPILQQVLTLAVACAVVASFKVVGSILVIAMIICPGASARMCTDRLHMQLLLSAFFATISAWGGYYIASFLPAQLGYDLSLSAAGMISVFSGILLAVCVIFSPAHGLLARLLRQLRLAILVRTEDILGWLYREEERKVAVTSNSIRAHFGGGFLQKASLRAATRNGYLLEADGIQLTEQGRARARELVRTHRLWESYLVTELGLDPEHVHETAERLEHFTKRSLRRRVQEKQDSPERDPHGKRIP